METTNENLNDESSLPVGKGEKSKNLKITIDIPRFITKISRTWDTSLFFSKDCWTKCTAYEITTIKIVLECLYVHRNYRDGRGIMQGDMAKWVKDRYNMGGGSMAFTLWKLTPICAALRSSGKEGGGGHVSRYWRITKVGELCYLEILKQQKMKRDREKKKNETKICSTD